MGGVQLAFARWTFGEPRSGVVLLNILVRWYFAGEPSEALCASVNGRDIPFFGIITRYDTGSVHFVRNLLHICLHIPSIGIFGHNT